MVVAAFACIAALGGPSFWSAFLLEQLQKGKKAYKGTKPFDHTKTKVWHQAQAYFAKPTPTNNNGANADANDTAARTFNATLGIPRNPSVFYTEVLAPPDNDTATEATPDMDQPTDADKDLSAKIAERALDAARKTEIAERALDAARKAEVLEDLIRMQLDPENKAISAENYAFMRQLYLKQLEDLYSGDTETERDAMDLVFNITSPGDITAKRWTAGDVFGDDESDSDYVISMEEVSDDEDVDDDYDEISLHSTSGEEEVDDDLDEVSLHCASDEEEVDDHHNEV